LSPEARRARVALPSPPSAVRVLPGAGREGLEAFVQARVDAARSEGEQAGRALERADAARVLAGAAESLEAARADALEAVGADSVKLAVEIAQYLLRAEIRADNYDLERIVRETLAASEAGRGACVVHVSPADAAKLDDVPFRAGTEIEADSDVPTGDVHVSTSHGLLVRDLEDSVREIGRRIMEADR
jgi:flagellar biosynthesis/type III secretory pathway protein FliH